MAKAGWTVQLAIIGGELAAVASDFAPPAASGGGLGLGALRGTPSWLVVEVGRPLVGALPGTPDPQADPRSEDDGGG